MRVRRDCNRARARHDPSQAFEEVDSADREILARCRGRGPFLRGSSAAAEVPFSHPLPQATALLHLATKFNWCTSKVASEIQTFQYPIVLKQGVREREGIVF